MKTKNDTSKARSAGLNGIVLLRHAQQILTVIWGSPLRASAIIGELKQISCWLNMPNSCTACLTTQAEASADQGGLLCQV